MTEGKAVMPNIVDELSYSTVRLSCTRADGSISIGTGFAMAFKEDKAMGLMIPVLLTNKHVVKNSVKVSFVLTEMIGGKPSAGRFSVELPVLESQWKAHPDQSVDLCALPIGMMLNTLKSQGKAVKITYLPMDIIATTKDLDSMSQLDEVVMIGYPDGIADNVNNQPIFRKGTFATNPSLDYNGNRDFIIDIAAYNGSSGSPVFVKYDAARFDANHASIVIGGHSSVSLVGVLYASFQHQIDGRIVPVQIPTAVVPIPVSAVPNNLGIVLKAERIKELEALF